MMTFEVWKRQRESAGVCGYAAVCPDLPLSVGVEHHESGEQRAAFAQLLRPDRLRSNAYRHGVIISG